MNIKLRLAKREFFISIFLSFIFFCPLPFAFAVQTYNLQQSVGHDVVDQAQVVEGGGKLLTHPHILDTLEVEFSPQNNKLVLKTGARCDPVFMY